MTAARVFDADLVEPGEGRRPPLGILVRNAADLLAFRRTLPAHVWHGRHRAMLVLLWLNSIGVLAFALVMGYALEHALAEAAVIAATAAIAHLRWLSPRTRSVAASFGMLGTSALLVHFSGGYIEAHFHFFVAIMFIALYQDWIVFIAAIAFVLAHHGVIGVVDPASVYNHGAARSEPWRWAGIHAGFIAMATVANVLAWRLYEPLQDPLTQLAMPVLFRKRLTRALRDDSRRAAILFMDLDEFKAVNDTVGHEAGDQLLRLVARRIEATLREGDTLARLGGDEFAMLISDCRDDRHALAMAERVSAAIALPFEIGTSSIVIRASIGIAIARRGDAPDAGQLLRNADLAMYAAKHGHDGPRVFEPAMHERIVARTELRAELRKALASADLDVHYQPVFGGGGAGIASAEALARWPHPVRGMIPSATFIPEAEAAGLVAEVGRFVLTRALADLARWRAEGRVAPAFQIRVNVSAAELADEPYVAHVARALHAARVPASALILEVTESVLLKNVEGVALRLGRLKALGVRISIDDFGSGHASYRYVDELPVDELKVDGAFVARMIHDRGSRAIVRSMIVLAHDLGLTVVAEGVQDAATLSALAELGPEYLQGYLLAMPMAGDALEDFLSARAREHGGRHAASARTRGAELLH